MVVYFSLIFIIPAIFTILCHKKKNYTLALALSILTLYLVSSLRHVDMGADSERYMLAFNRIAANGTYYMEKGYVLFNRLVYLAFHSYRALIICLNVLIFFPLFLFIKKYVKKEYWMVSVMAFLLNPYMFIQSTFNALRQGCAMGIILIAVIFLLNENMKPFLRYFGFFLFVLVAAQFHQSAYLMLLLPLFFIIKFNQQFWLIAAIICLTLNIVGFTGLLNRVLSVIGYEQYLNYESSLLNNPLYTIFIFAGILLFVDHYAELTEDKQDKKYVDLYIFSLCFLLIAVANDMIYRFYLILAIISFPGLAVVLSKSYHTGGWFKLREGRVFVRCVYIAYYLFFFVGYISYMAILQNTNYVPFRFFFQA